MNRVQMTKIVTQSAFFVGLVLLAKFFTLSFLVGSQTARLSGLSIIVPLAGAFGGIIGGSFIFLLRLIVGLFSNNFSSFQFLAFCVPGLCASFYWASSHAVIRLVLPAVCMMLFIIHPVGAQAFPYALYWLIPIVLYFVRSKNLFLRSLGSTFVAHAVGSVIWLYTVPMTADLWLYLIPIVLVERLLFASGMVVMHQVLAWLFEKVASVLPARRFFLATK